MAILSITENDSDSALVLPWATQPGSFTALMTLYESNYIRLGSLLAGQLDEDARCRSVVSNDLPLYLDVVEVCRYTTTLRMTYLFDEVNGKVADPDLRIRLYKDARLVEAMDCVNHGRHRALRNYDTAIGTELRRRWTRNVMLNKWLEYCIDVGHEFEIRSPAGAADPAHDQ